MTIRAIRRRTAEKLGATDRLPCCDCKTPASRKTLADHGGRCYPCFQAYCRAAPSKGAP